MLKSRLLGAIGIVAVVGGVLTAQTLVPPAFEVTSVKRNLGTDLNGGGRFLPGGLFTVTNMPVRALLGLAFRRTPPLLGAQIVGMPDWGGTERYDVTAKMSADALQGGMPTADQTQNAVRSLLEDRFKFRSHFESRELPMYALVVAVPSGRLGPQLRPSVGNCAARRALSDAAGPNQQPVQPCGIQGGPGHFVGVDMVIGTLMGMLANSTGRVVEDRTQLTGRYDVILDWTADPTADSDRVSIFTAIQEQLGLKLESTTGRVDVLVIDHVEHPTEN